MFDDSSESHVSHIVNESSPDLYLSIIDNLSPIIVLQGMIMKVQAALPSKNCINKIHEIIVQNESVLKVTDQWESRKRLLQNVLREK